jgi:phosphoribosylanthranilate isomerase
MPLKSVVKVSHISNLSDARYCAGMGVDMLGFTVRPGREHYMGPAVFQEIRGWISGPKIVAELYGISSAEDIRTAMQSYSPDYFELSLDEFDAYERDLSLPCIVYLSNPADAARLTREQKISHVLVDEDTDCSGISSVQIPVMINIKSLENLKAKLAADCFQGFVVEGPQALRPGITNYDQLGIILEALEEE